MANKTLHDVLSRFCEEVGEHWTARDAVSLMAILIFLPVANRIEIGTCPMYDCDK